MPNTRQITMWLGLVAAATSTPLGAMERSIADLANGNANKRIVLEYLELAWNQGKRDEARARYFSDHFVNHPAERPNPGQSGRPPQIKYEVRELIAENDLVVVHSIVRGFGISQPISTPFGQGGIKVGDDVVDIFQLKDGKIIAKSDTVQATDTEDLFITQSAN